MFPTQLRGMAVGISSALNRVVSIGFPLLAQYLLSINVRLPLYISASLYLVAGLCAAFLPYETKGLDLK